MINLALHAKGISVRRGILPGSLFAGLLAGVLALDSSSATAQERANELPQSSGTTSAATVSVASLRVSAEARKHYHLAIAANNLHRDQECDREIAKALEMSPDFPEVYLLRAIVEVNRHAFDAAVADVLAAQRLDAGLPWAPVAMAEAYNGLRRYQDALLLLENLHGSIFETWQVKYEMARAEVGLRRTEDALYWSSRALAVSPQSFAEGHLLYASALELSARWSEASKELRLYLASPGTQVQRASAISALAFVDSKALEQASRVMAGRPAAE